MADFSMSDMPWLGQPADPAGSLLRGVQAGAAISGARTQRAALAQRKMEFDQQASIQEREWRERMAMLPLEMTLKQQQNQMNALNIQNTLEQRQQQIEDAKQLNVASRDISAALSERDPQGALVSWLDHTSINSRLLKNPMFLELRKTIELAGDATQELMRAEAYRVRNEGLTESAEAKLALDRERQSRLREEFAFRKQQAESRVPQHRLSTFRSRARVIENDLTLIGNEAEKMRRLVELEKEFEAANPSSVGGEPSSAAPAPSPSPVVPGKKIGRFEVVPK